MNYEEKYNNAIESIKRIYDQADSYGRELMEKEFTELRESEDERMRNFLIDFIKVCVWSEKQFPPREECIAWLEKQGEQKPYMIQWKGHNLKEIVEFTGKSPKFNDWFKTWEEYENYVHTHNNIFKIFNEDGSHIEVPVGAWIIKTPDGYNIASRYVFKQKPADKVGPKFKIGDWITNGEYTWKVTDIKPLDYILQSQNGDTVDDTISYVDEEFHLWTIEDARDGDVLAEHETIVLFKKIEGQNIRCYCTYYYLGFNPAFYVSTLQNKNPYCPATKEQCDTLMKAMADAGYRWNKEELKLEKI